MCMRGNLLFGLGAAVLAVALAGVPTASAGGGATPVFGGAVWADGVIWGTILTTNSLPAGADADSWDLIFVFDNSGLRGQRPVGEAAPYEEDYNGGRWNVQGVTFTPDGLAVHDGVDRDGMVNFELKSDDEVRQHMGLGHFTSAPAGVYFSCPLVPATG